MASISVKIEGLNTRMASALRHAVAVIESYEMDIHNSQQHFDVDLVALGFCQGTIYTNALARIEHILDGTLAIEATL